MHLLAIFLNSRNSLSCCTVQQQDLQRSPLPAPLVTVQTVVISTLFNPETRRYFSYAESDTPLPLLSESVGLHRALFQLC